MIGRVLKKHGGFYNVANDGQIYECKLSGKQKYKQKDYIVAGDFVEFDFDEGEKEAQGYITAIRPRENYIPRPGIANIDQILIVAGSFGHTRLTVARLTQGTVSTATRTASRSSVK